MPRHKCPKQCMQNCYYIDFGKCPYRITQSIIKSRKKTGLYNKEFGY